ncbi:MAG: hypothetical protein V7K71_11730 [Nostoc sp.]|uniref:hypothetical protein n=1 Tax=Nostoc sp. TaxID=1180 RepID=UPI002FF57AD7
MKILNHKNGINHHKDAMNRRLYNNQSFVEMAIHRVSCLKGCLKSLVVGSKKF